MSELCGAYKEHDGIGCVLPIGHEGNHQAHASELSHDEIWDAMHGVKPAHASEQLYRLASLDPQNPEPNRQYLAAWVVPVNQPAHASEDAGYRLAKLLRDQYWAQTPLDVAKLADEVLAGAAHASEGTLVTDYETGFEK